MWARLRNGAYKWLLTKSSTINNFDDFKSAFKNTFTYARSLSEKLKRMVARVQNRGEFLEDYVLDKIWLCDGLKLTVGEIRDEIASGLWSKDLAQHLLACEYTSTDGILQDLTKVDKTYENLRGRILENRERSKFECNSDQRGKLPRNESTINNGNKGSSQAAIGWHGAERQHGGASDIGSSTSSNSKKSEGNKNFSKNVSNFKNIKCNNCGELGHIARQCTEPKREFTCYTCNKPGHIASQCPTNNKNQNVRIEEVKTVSTLDSRVMGEKFIRNIVVGNYPCTAQIDMGATVCTIKSTFVITSGFHITYCNSSLEGFGANLINSPGVVKENILLDNLKARNISFRIVPDTCQKYDVILGQTFTEIPDLAYCRRGNDLIFEDVVGDIPVEKNMKVFANENSVLEPGCVNFINVKFNKTEVSMPIINMCEEQQIIKENEYFGESIMSIEPAKILKSRTNEIKMDEVICDESISIEQKQELVKLLNEYRICIAKDVSEIQETNVMTMDIELKDNTPIIPSQPYKLNSKDRDDLDKLIDEYRQAGIVTDTTSSYASPVFVVRKKDGSARMVVDYRNLNRQTKVLPYPIPNFDDCLEKLNGARFFTTLDLACGYLQMPLTESAKEKTAFITETQTGQFERAMFGLMNAPRYFAKMMDIILRKLRKKGRIFYFFDDMCIFAISWYLMLLYLKRST